MIILDSRKSSEVDCHIHRPVEGTVGQRTKSKEKKKDSLEMYEINTGKTKDGATFWGEMTPEIDLSMRKDCKI